MEKPKADKGVTQFIPVDRIVVSTERQRSTLKDIEGMRLSIDTYGQLQPIIVQQRTGEDGQPVFHLLAGLRRLTAMKSLGFTEVEAKLRENLTELERQELEYEENTRRMSLPWYDEIITLAKLHRLKKVSYETALPDRFGSAIGWRLQDTAETYGVSLTKVSEDLRLADGIMKFPQLKNLTSRRQAQKRLKELLSGEAKPDNYTEIRESIMESFVRKDYWDISQSIEPKSQPFILTDVSMQSPVQWTEELARILAPRGNAILFISAMQLVQMGTLLESAGLRHDKEGRILHIKNDDSFLTYIWVGARDTTPPGSEFRNHYSHELVDTVHEKDKPYAFIHFLLKFFAVKSVLDPFSYGGITAKVATQLQKNYRCYTTVEEDVYNEAVNNIVKLRLEKGLY